MLQYNSNESANSSHFFITSPKESLYILSLQKVEEEEIAFDSEYLQENILQMTIARASQPRECYSKALAKTIKQIFDTVLFKRDDLILYLSLRSDSGKDKLIERYISEDSNDEFEYFVVDEIADYTFYFFFNKDKTDSFRCLSSILEYFKNEYNIDLRYKYDKE